MSHDKRLDMIIELLHEIRASIKSHETRISKLEVLWKVLGVTSLGLLAWILKLAIV